MVWFKTNKIEFTMAWLLAAMLLFQCKEHSYYNPFDEQINVSLSHFCKNGCDTIVVSDDYFKLIQKGDDSVFFYYMFDIGDWKKPIAKGFTIYGDTLSVEVPAYKVSMEMRDSLKNLESDKTKLIDYLDLYDYGLTNLNSNNIVAFNQTLSDTIYINEFVNFIDQNRLVRIFHFSKYE